jgi:ubiquinone/menaquinone biosynthesis C-methylase UbiE
MQLHSGMSNYIHGSLPTEQERLTRLNDLINRPCLALLDPQAGECVLDVGSGLGQLSLMIAEKVGPNGKCLGIERDQNQLKTALQNLENANTPWVEFRQGNAENLELQHGEWGTFDVAHTRFVLEHVHQPESVLLGMTKAVRPGGKVVLADDDHMGLCLYPEPLGFPQLWQAYIRSYDRLGNDPFIGRRMVSLLYQAGLRHIRNNVVFFGDNAGSPTFQTYADNLIGILNGVKELLIKEGLTSEPVFQDTLDRLHSWVRLPDAALWYTIYWAAGEKS